MLTALWTQQYSQNHLIDLRALETEVLKWLNTNFPRALMFFDYHSIVQPALEVAFGMTSRKELVQLDLLGIEDWGMPSALKIEFRELIIRRLEDLCLQVVGERVHHGNHRYIQHGHIVLIIEMQ